MSLELSAGVGAAAVHLLSGGSIGFFRLESLVEIPVLRLVVERFGRGNPVGKVLDARQCEVVGERTFHGELLAPVLRVFVEVVVVDIVFYLYGHHSAQVHLVYIVGNQVGRSTVEGRSQVVEMLVVGVVAIFAYDISAHVVAFLVVFLDEGLRYGEGRLGRTAVTGHNREDRNE